MPYPPRVLTLPLESEQDAQSINEETFLLSVETQDKTQDKSTPPAVEDEKKKADSKKREKDKREKNAQRFSRLKFTWLMIRWHILLFFAISSSLYAIFHYGFDKSQKKLILQALAFCDDWKQLVFFFGIYLSFAVKKVSDVTSHIPPTDKIANLVSIAINKNKTQKAIMKYLITAIAMVFSFISPMVRKRLFSSEEKIKAKVDGATKKLIEKIEKKLVNVNSSHFMPIKWTLHVIYEARGREEVDEKLFNTLVAEINAVHTACDRLIGFKHETFSWGLTQGAKTSVYTYFVVGAIRQFWTGLSDNHSNYILSAALTVNFLVFLAFLVVLRCAEQIVQPYNTRHDIFELNRILNDKLEVAAFVLNKDCDLRMRMKDQVLLP